MPKKRDPVLAELQSIRKLLTQVHKKQAVEEKILRTNEEKLDESLLEPSIARASSDSEELAQIKALETDLKKDLESSPLKRITYKDITKGMVGAFLAVVSDFAFADGARISEYHSFARSTFLLILSFIIIVGFIYFTGFRKVNDKFVFKFLPVRAIVLYVSSIVTTVIVLIAYGSFMPYIAFSQVYSTVASISILAVLGAGTADLIGKE